MNATERTHKEPRGTFALTLALILVLLPVAASAQQLPAGWGAADVGSPAMPGYASYSPTTDSFMVSGAGTGIAGTSDQFTFAYQVVTGDVTLVARIGGMNNAPTGAHVGLMIRQGLAADARHAAILATPTNGILFKRRGTPGQATATTTVAGTAPVWLKLERRWTSVTVSWSRDGAIWTVVGTDVVDMNNALHVGLASTSSTEVAAARGHFSNVQLTTLARSGNPLPAGWSAADVGAPAASGAAAHDAGAFGIEGSGDVAGASDQFHFVYRQFSGNVDVTARVRDLGNASANSKAGIMLRESLTATSPHASMFVTAGSGTVFQRRPTAGAASVTTAGGTLSTPVWLKLSLRQSTVTAYQSADGVTWAIVGTQSITLPSPFYVGLAVASGAGGLVAANVDGVTVEASSQNTPPAVNMTSPANGAVYTAPATVTVSANASDTDGTVARVEFYRGTTLLGTDTTSPYSITWSDVPEGSYSIYAVAVDDDSAATTSASRSITVLAAPGNQPPTVSLTAPANGATFSSPATISISASAGDTDGLVVRVDFYRDGALLGSDTSSPYTFTWNGVVAGTYSLTAVAIDNSGATAVSPARQVTVNPRATIAFGPSPDHNTLVTSYVMEVFAEGANPSTATPIATQSLGKPPVVNGECSADVTPTINGLAPGNYVITVGAVGEGGMSRSGAMPFSK